MAKTANKEENNVKTPKKEREFREVSEQRGEVKIPKDGESIEGIYTLKKGRKISEYETPTLELFDSITENLQLVPMNVVLENKLKVVLEKYGEQYHYLRVTNLGKKTARDGKSSYVNWKIEISEATAVEIQLLGQYEEAQE